MSDSNQTTTPSKFTWGAVIAAYLCIPPLGIIFLLIKISTERASVYKHGVILTICSSYFAFWTYLSMCCLGDELRMTTGAPSLQYTYIISTLFFASGTLLMLLLGISKIKQGRKYQKYLDCIVYDDFGSPDALADKFSRPIDQVEADLKRMRRAGYFDGIRFPYTNSEVVVQPTQVIHVETRLIFDDIPDTPQPVICKNCGAQCTGNGDGTGECEYCGSPLK